ncbi:MAG: Protein TolB [Fimbriimonadaceae bacterium]|nr:Protein TolB [Fimbriimonadaceae bacterium]
MKTKTRSIALIVGCVLVPFTLVGCWGIAWSPDGTHLVFTWGYGIDEQPALAVMDVATRSLQTLPDSDSPAMPQWSPKGDRIAFISSQSSGDELRIFDAPSTRTRTIAKFPVGFVWSSDGRQIAYVEKRGEQEARYTCVRYDLDSGKIAQRIPLPKGVISDIFLCWLPKTDGVAFLSAKGNSGDIYIAEFGKVRKVTNTGDIVGFTTSQDGNFLVWARKSRNPKNILLFLYRYDLDLRNVQRIPFPNRIPQVNPDQRHGPKNVEWVFFSPNLQKMILYLDHDVPPAKNKNEPHMVHGSMVVMRFDGTGAKTIADWQTHSNDIYWPAFSWDSKRIAIQHIGSSCQIITLNADGSNKKVVLNKGK